MQFDFADISIQVVLIIGTDELLKLYVCTLSFIGSVLMIYAISPRSLLSLSRLGILKTNSITFTQLFEVDWCHISLVQYL